MNTKSKDTILLTGATGFIGNHLCQKLITLGYKPRLLVRNPDKLNKSIKNECHIFIGSLNDKAILNKACENVDYIFHLAANVNTWDSWENYYKTNVTGSINLLYAIDQNAPQLKKLIYLSTVDVYGYPNHPGHEKTKLKPSPYYYGESKRIAEIIIRNIAQKKNINTTVFRPCNVIGLKSPFIIRISEQLDSLMLIINKGQCHAGLLSIDNLINALIWSMDGKKAKGEIYNIRDNANINWNAFIYALKSATAKKGIIISLPYKLAKYAAFMISAFYKLTFPQKEPLLHPLIVDMFGKNTNHDIKKILKDSHIELSCDLNSLIQSSINKK